MSIEVKPVQSLALEYLLPELAALRITIFRDYPYLYEGDLAYEQRYLKPYAQSDKAIVVGAWDSEKLVGAATGMPITEHDDGFSDGFASHHYPLERLYYCAESVLLPEYRGKGIGHRFFDFREDHARSLGMEYCCFCAVIRPDEHPAKPADHRSLEPFWRKRGYAPVDGLTTAFSWKEVGQEKESEQQLQYWIREL